MIVKALASSSLSPNAAAGIAKLDDANDAGTRFSEDCTLILTEGDSAKALAVAGLSVVGRNRYGVFPLRCATLSPIASLSKLHLWSILLAESLLGPLRRLSPAVSALKPQSLSSRVALLNPEDSPPLAARATVAFPRCARGSFSVDIKFVSSARSPSA